MIKAILVDDEPDARFLLKNMLQKHLANVVEILAEASDVFSAVSAIDEHHPDVVFLDIKMREGTGFDVLEKVKEKNFEVVFVTAFDQFAIKAFQFSATGYLMKPVKTKELIQVVDEIVNRQRKLKESADKRIKVLIENYGDDRKIKKLVISHVDGFKVFSLEEIIRLEGDRNYTHFILSGNRKVTSSKTLGQYESLLTEFGFMRVHQSTIINLRHVIGYIKGDGGMVEMSDKVKITVSRQRKTHFLERFLQ